MTRRFFFSALAAVIAFPKRLSARPNITVRSGPTPWKPTPDQLKVLEPFWREQERWVMNVKLVERHFNHWGNA